MSGSDNPLTHLISEIDPASWEGRVLVRGWKEGEGDGEEKWLVERVRTKTTRRWGGDLSDVRAWLGLKARALAWLERAWA
jgi:hypothetical protein